MTRAWLSLARQPALLASQPMRRPPGLHRWYVWTRDAVRLGTSCSMERQAQAQQGQHWYRRLSRRQLPHAVPHAGAMPGIGTHCACCMRGPGRGCSQCASSWVQRNAPPRRRRERGSCRQPHLAQQWPTTVVPTSHDHSKPAYLGTRSRRLAAQSSAALLLRWARVGLESAAAAAPQCITCHGSTARAQGRHRVAMAFATGAWGLRAIPLQRSGTDVDLSSTIGGLR